jgi:hypothetical protein
MKNMTIRIATMLRVRLEFTHASDLGYARGKPFPRLNRLETGLYQCLVCISLTLTRP